MSCAGPCGPPGPEGRGSGAHSAVPREPPRCGPAGNADSAGGAPPPRAAAAGPLVEVPPAASGAVVSGPAPPATGAARAALPPSQPDDCARRIELDADDAGAGDAQHGVECGGDAHPGPREGCCRHGNLTGAKCASSSFTPLSSATPTPYSAAPVHLPTQTRGAPEFAKYFIKDDVELSQNCTTSTHLRTRPLTG